jgi:hypothetical protein
MPLRCRSAVPVALAFLLLVGSSGVVQVAAWAGMIAARTPLAGWDQALRSTLSGESPCALCRAARALADTQPGIPGTPKPGDQKQLKTDLGLPAREHWPVHAALRPPHPRSQPQTLPSGRTPSPEPPPPRTLVVDAIAAFSPASVIS